VNTATNGNTGIALGQDVAKQILDWRSTDAQCHPLFISKKTDVKSILINQLP
jgi:hypothetical protein